MKVATVKYVSDTDMGLFEFYFCINLKYEPIF